MVTLQEIVASSQPMLIVSARPISEEAVKEKLGLTPFNSRILDFENQAPTVSEIRQILKEVSYRPQFDQFFFLVFLKAELLSPEIANTLLKTLEEPPEYLRILLFTSNERALLPTVLSRCRKKILPPPEMRPDAELVEVEEVTRMTLAERFALAEKLSRENPLPQLENWLFQIRQQNFPSKYRALFKVLLDSHQKLSNYNLNKRLLLENLFLAWPEE